MSISLSKDNSVNLTKKTRRRQKKIMIGLGWNTRQNNIDLDAAAFMLTGICTHNYFFN
jgi:stress response protein SCP2